MYVMNDFDKASAKELFSYLAEEAGKEKEHLYKGDADYYTESVLKEGAGLLSDVSKFGISRDYTACNKSLQEYLDLMKRRYTDFTSLKVEPVARMGNPHYIGQVILRERRAAYILNSYLKGAGAQDDFCTQYGINIMACGKNSMEKIRERIHVDPRYPFQITRAYRIRNQERDDLFYSFMEKEGYSDKDIHFAYNATVNPAMLGVICDGMRFEGADPIGLLFGSGGYLSQKAAKTAGYTSLSGSRWRNGTSSKGYICLYKVLYKNPLHLGAGSSMSGGRKFTKDTLAPYDMVWAHKGYLMGPGRSLKAGEQVVYDERQLTLMYVIEITN